MQKREAKVCESIVILRLLNLTLLPVLDVNLLARKISALAELQGEFHPKILPTESCPSLFKFSTHSCKLFSKDLLRLLTIYLLSLTHLSIISITFASLKCRVFFFSNPPEHRLTSSRGFILLQHAYARIQPSKRPQYIPIVFESRINFNIIFSSKHGSFSN